MHSDLAAIPMVNSDKIHAEEWINRQMEAFEQKHGKVFGKRLKKEEAQQHVTALTRLLKQPPSRVAKTILPLVFLTIICLFFAAILTFTFLWYM